MLSEYRPRPKTGVTVGFWRNLADAARPGKPEHKRRLKSMELDRARMQAVGALLDAAPDSDLALEAISRASREASKGFPL